jgi:hypothetical protein
MPHSWIHQHSGWNKLKHYLAETTPVPYSLCWSALVKQNSSTSKSFAKEIWINITTVSFTSPYHHVWSVGFHISRVVIILFDPAKTFLFGSCGKLNVRLKRETSSSKPQVSWRLTSAQFSSFTNTGRYATIRQTVHTRHIIIITWTAACVGCRREQ